MTEILLQYGLFVLKAITVVVAFAVVLALAFGYSRRSRATEKLEVSKLNDKYDDMKRIMKEAMLPKKEFRRALKDEKTRKKQEQKRSSGSSPRRRVFVIDFHGDIRASGTAALREEITAVLSMATSEDEVVVRLENYGGLVHEHGLAATQLLRIRDRGVPLTVAVDKVAASGGYMMACVAQRIVAAPFAVVGSIGVVAQLPNFHRLLDRHGIDVEQMKAGELKRTVTMFGENTEKDREEFSRQLEDTHALFKDFVVTHRPELDIARISTGEHWYGTRAVEFKLVDELITSDDYLMRAASDADLFAIRYTAPRSLGERLSAVVSSSVNRLLAPAGERNRIDRLVA